MSESYFFEQVFHQQDLPKKLTGIEFDQCRFIQCDFSGRDVSNTTFIECDFNFCNLSLCRTINTSFQQVVFNSCKLMGLHFEHCNKHGLDFTSESCVFDNSIFYQCVIKKMVFKQASLIEVDFTETQAQQVVFSDCDLSGATFEKTHLEQADLSSSRNYRINPTKNHVKGAQFSSPEVLGLLQDFDITIR
jgi:uncharacterized protein YjbI with pentapeptide repeats